MDNKEQEMTYSQKHSYFKRMRENAKTDMFYIGTNPVVELHPEQVFNGIQHFVSYSPSSLEAGLLPFEYTGWANEMKSWHESCYIHANLNPTPTCRVTGSDSMKFLTYYCANSFKNFQVGAGKHGIMCNSDGLLMADGVLIRTGEEEFLSYWMNPWMQYCAETSGMDVKAEDIMGQVFLFQLGGPRSLEIVEAACGESCHDLKFFHLKMAKIAGKNVRIVRVGMAGALAYEVHGNIEDSRDVYKQLLRAGEKYGLAELGTCAYNMTHTENGFPNMFLDFIFPWYDDPAFAEWLQEKGVGMTINSPMVAPMYGGSIGPGFENRYRNPIELGWGKTINFDHDFLGKEALEKIAAGPHRVMVTLEWNIDDCLDVIRSQFEQGEPYMDMSAPDDCSYGTHVMLADKVLDENGKYVGIATNRIRSSYYRSMISLCTLDQDYAELGKELYVLWGYPGMRQKKIRVTVSRYPYNDKDRNQKVDVDKIPQGTMD